MPEARSSRSTWQWCDLQAQPDKRHVFPTAISSEQVWAARSLLGWSRDRLSAESDVTYGFIVKYERLGLVPALFSRERDFDGLAAIRAAFEQAGVVFDPDKLGVSMRQDTACSSFRDYEGKPPTRDQLGFI